jgi:ribosomal protein S18 acetylase RimI-like enzyme
MTIERLNQVNEKVLKDMNMLVLQLSSRGYQMDIAQLNSVIKDKNNIVTVVLDDGHIVGMITLVIIHQVTGNKGYLEDLVIDEKYRGKGLGEKLVTEAISIARKSNIESVELKSETHRIAANKLYQKLGFELKEANVYKVKLV